MNFKYIVISNDYSTESESRVGYGIAAAEDEKILESVCDLTPDLERIERLVRLCNEHKLELVHLKDVAEDFVLSE